MKTHEVTISGLEQVNEEVCLKIKAGSYMQPIAGQFFQAFAADSEELLPTLLYPCRVSPTELLLGGSIPKSWSPGTELRLRGPRGNGFHLLPLAKKAALTTLDLVSLNPLMALADAALANSVEVTLFTNQHLSGLAPEIEVLPLDELNQAVHWADYLAAVLPLKKINDFRNSLQLKEVKITPFSVEVLLQTPMICDENSACGVCSVYTSRGWRLACKDGPVFALDDLLSEDGSLG